MADYFAVVAPNVPLPPVTRVERAEWGSATILCIRARVRITFEMAFPSQEQLDRFLSMGRHRAAGYLCGGRITAMTPTPLLDLALKTYEEDGESDRLSAVRIANVFGITPNEFRIARRMAHAAILETYRRTPEP